MPRAKPKPEAPQAPAPEANGPASEVLTLAEAAAYLRLPEKEVLRLVQTQDLPGRLAGSEWRFLKSAIQRWLSVPALKANKEAWMALAGAWKDDPYAEEELKEIYRRRGRPATEDES